MDYLYLSGVFGAGVLVGWIIGYLEGRGKR